VTKTLAVLVVDDDEVVRIAVSRQLKSIGAGQVETAHDGPSARRELGRGTAFDLIICDLMLPGIDGVEFLREVARIQPRAALVLISGLDDRIVRSVAVLSRERGLRVLGALRKPVRPEALQQLIDGLTTAPGGEPRKLYGLGMSDVLRGLGGHSIGARVQPKRRTADGQLHGAELLLHWEDQRLGTVATLDLLRIAEKFGMTHTLAEYTLEMALRIVAQWVRAGLQVPVSVNLSAAALRRLDLPDRIAGLIKAAGVSPALLTVEISENTLSDEPELLDVLTRLRMRDVRVALDNFGSGYGSLLRLQRLPVNEVKLDRTFVRGLGSGTVGTTIVEYSIKMAKALGLETVAVGVETAEQAQLLTTLGCDALQGYHIAPPMAPEELPAWGGGRPLAAAEPVVVNTAVPAMPADEALAA